MWEITPLCAQRGLVRAARVLKLPQIVGRPQGANARPVWWRVGMRVRFKFDTPSLGRRDLRGCTETFRGHDESRRDSDPVDLVAAFRNGDTV